MIKSPAGRYLPEFGLDFVDDHNVISRSGTNVRDCHDPGQFFTWQTETAFLQDAYLADGRIEVGDVR
jgi:hypothetical protein